MIRFRYLTLPLAATLVAACSVAPAGMTPPGAGATPGPVALPGLTFRPVTAADAQLVSSQATGRAESTGGGGTATGAPAAAPAPMAPTAPAADARGGGATGMAFSGNMYGYYGWGWYYGGSEEVALVAFEQADAPGASGDFPTVARTVADPIVAAWATDARLVQTSAGLRPDGTPIATGGSGGGAVPPDVGIAKTSPSALEGGGGWRLVYVSSARKEVLHFLIRPDKTLVLRQRWAPLALPLDRVAVNSTAAIQKLTAAIEDRAFKGEEERTGTDYFMGFPFTAPQAGYGPETQVEVVYDVPADVRWDASLQQIMGKLVWQLSFYADSPAATGGSTGVGVAVGVATPVSAPAPATAPAAPAADMPAKPPVEACRPIPAESSTWFNNHASGMVDAESGAVIRFSRPTRTTWTRPAITCPPTPAPTPTASPSPSPSP